MIFGEDYGKKRGAGIKPFRNRTWYFDMFDSPTYEALRKRVRELEARLAADVSSNDPNASEKIPLSEIIEGNSIPTFVIDRHHVLTHFNRACENLTGISAQELLGTRDQWRAFYASPRPVLADLLVDKVPESEIRAHYSNKYRPSRVIEGAYEAEDFFPALGENGRWLFFTAAVLRNGRGEIIGAIETLQDITEQKQAEEAVLESRRRYRTLLDFVPYPIVVSTLSGSVYYVNPAFTELFGWALPEIQGRKNPFIPSELEPEAARNLEFLKQTGSLNRYITRRLRRDGQLRDVAITATTYSEFQGERAGTLEIMRDITQEREDARRSEAILRISRVLPEYPDLEDLLDYISDEIKHLMGTEGALVILHDEETHELFFLGAAYDDAERERRVKKIRFSVDELTAGEVIRTGEPMIINDTTESSREYPSRDAKFGYHTRNFLLTPIHSNERIIGILAALNRKAGQFDESHVELLTMLAGSVALSIENARYADELKKAYLDVQSMNRAKDKAIHHLSHELKTPISVMSGSLKLLEKRLSERTEDGWRPAMERADRNLGRIISIQEEVEDIMKGVSTRYHDIVSRIFDRCADVFLTFLEEETGRGPTVEAVRNRITGFFGDRELPFAVIDSGPFILGRLETLSPRFAHRNLEIIPRIEPTPPIYLPADSMEKIVDGLVRNAVENTPDQGRIEIRVHPEGTGTRFEVHDFGVGLTETAESRIFEGFFTTRDIQDYSSRRPFDFNAGGKGMDLLRMKIFSERYGFDIGLRSTRCGFIPTDPDLCPGRIEACRFCRRKEDCHESGHTVFTLYFPPPPDSPNPIESD